MVRVSIVPKSVFHADLERDKIAQTAPLLIYSYYALLALLLYVVIYYDLFIFFIYIAFLYRLLYMFACFLIISVMLAC